MVISKLEKRLLPDFVRAGKNERTVVMSDVLPASGAPSKRRPVLFERKLLRRRKNPTVGYESPAEVGESMGAYLLIQRLLKQTRSGAIPVV